MAAFDGYIQRAFGHPVVGFDDEVGGPAMWGARKFLQMRRQMQQRQGLRGFDEDEIAALMGMGDQVGADDMDELGAALAEDNDDEEEEELGADSVSGRGKSLSELREDLRDLQAKLNKAESKLARTRFGPAKKIRQKKVDRLERRIGKKKEQIQYLLDLQRAPGGGGDRPGLDPNRPGAGVLQRGVTNLDVQGRVISPPRAGRQVSIPLLYSGNPYATAAFAASVANSSTAFSFTSAQITYARFFLLGVRINAWLYADNGTTPYTVTSLPIQMQARIHIANLNADGYPNALYGAQIISLGGQFGSFNSKDIVDGIRDNSLIQQNNTITCSGSVQNPFAIGTGLNMSVALSIEALLNVIEDDLFGKAP